MPVDWLDAQLIENVAASNGRAVGSALVLLAGVALYLSAPFLVRRLVGLRRFELVERHLGGPITTLEESISWPFPTRAVIRTLQSVVVVAVGLAMLILWGYRAQAVWLLEVVAAALPWLVRLLTSVGLIAGGIVGTRILERRLQEYSEGAEHVTAHQEGVAFRVLQITVFGAVGIAIVSIWGVDLTGVFVGAGFVGIVFGMAARRTLGSLIAGLVLMFSRPFELGDWVEIGDHEGIVTDISIINTRLRSFDDETIVIPNDTVGNRAVTNYSDTQRLRLHLDVGIEYDTDIERAREVALDALEEIDEIERTPAPSALPVSFDDSSIGLRLMYWIRYPSKPKEWTAHTAVLQGIKRAFDREGVGIPFPQRELSGQVDHRPPGSDEQLETAHRSTND